MITPELFAAMRTAYIEELREGYSTWSSEHDGLLHLGIDVREEMKHKYIAPTLIGFEQYQSAFDENGRHTVEDEINIIIPFMERLENAMQEQEKEFIENIVFLLETQENS